MRMTTLLIHALPGGVGIVTGFLALSVAKGGGVHRKSGLLFVGAMILLALSGAVIAAVGGGEASVVAGLLTFYLVCTAIITVRPLPNWSRRVNVALMIMALTLGLVATALGFDAVSRGGVREGIPAVILFKFAVVALLAFAGDLKVMRSGALKGASRLARHLWRMCFALYIASASFFLGQADVLPEAVRIPAILAVPAFAPLLVMFYWLWRVRVRRRLQGIVGVSAREAY
jgi:hypothetical protein